MRLSLRHLLVVTGLVAGACQNNTVSTGTGTLPPPQNLAYQLDPSGDPNRPAGILLAWDDVQSTDLASYRIYSRGSTGGSFLLRGETTSNTFHDNGVPHLQYYVTAVDGGGGESDPSNTITVDERLQLAAPDTLGSISLNQAIHLGWADNAAQSTRFKWYRVYSASYNLDTGLCGTDWVLEGNTVSNEFLATLLPNGTPRCFGVSAISTEGYESLWTVRQDTPRPDARNVLVYAFQTDADSSGFRFWSDLDSDGVGQPSELGLIQNGSRTDIDFVIHRHADSTLWVVPVFTGTSLQLYSTSPVADLTSIDFAPASGYSGDSLLARPGFGYVFEIVDGTVLHYGALRMTHVGRQYVIFDWSVQTDPGNPELVVPRKPAPTGTQVAGSR
jgi:fibronectin type 3 domain-containing protein